MAIEVYKSTDTSAPTLSGTAGDLVKLLDAVLVNGYGSKSAAGWSKAYSGTNKAAYRTAAGSNQRYLRIDDTGTTSARMRGYEAMTDVDTGTGLFPTDAQLSGGAYWVKSSAASTSTRPWWIVADDKYMIAFVDYANDSTSCIGHIFGDVPSYLAGDTYNTVIQGCNGTS